MTSFQGLGRRKTAIAHVSLQTGDGTHRVNKETLDQYFPTIALKRLVLGALLLVSQDKTYVLRASVRGGGKPAQAEAIRLGTARALLAINEAWRKQLKEAGFLTRDARMKERKKFGLKRARRAPQFSKR